MHLSIIPLVAAIFASAIVAAPANNLHLRDAAPIPTSCDANTQAACCDTVADPDDPAVQTLIGALGLLIPGGLIGQVGLTCDPILNVIPIGNGNSCAGQTVCCQQTVFNGLINLGCTPLDLTLL